MAFIDNSGDIILDAVLTDTGRLRLAKGDGSFKIAKFALADDEINYELYNKTHASGSAYYDLDILQTPILEAFTDNAASMKSKLVSNPRTNLLYLPIIKVNELYTDTAMHAGGTFMVAVDKDTETAITKVNNQTVAGILAGQNITQEGGNKIRLDQGLDTTDISPSVAIDSSLKETQYIVQIDNRFGQIASLDGQLAQVSYIDDDNIATYYISRTSGGKFVSDFHSTTDQSEVQQTIAGPRGTFLQFKIASSLELNTNTYLFDQLGSTTTMAPNNTSVQTIDTIVRVMGATTAYSVDIPVRFVKKV